MNRSAGAAFAGAALNDIQETGNEYRNTAA